MTKANDQLMFEFLGGDQIATRAANALRREGINTPGELRMAWRDDPDSLMDMRQVGAGCIRRIEESVTDPANHTAEVLAQVATERHRQIELWGDQRFPLKHRNDPEGIASPLGRSYAVLAESFKALGKALGPDDSWDRVLLEEVFEALAETDPAKMRTELIQVAAVAVKAVEEIDREAQGS